MILFIFIAQLVSCSNKKTLESFDHWIGTWEEIQADGTFTETWKKENDTLFLGSSAMVNGKDTLFSEEIRLVLRGKEVYYIPTVPSQNDEKPIEFKMITSSEKSWTFENKYHDFPKQIVYTLNNHHSLTATIQGTENNRSTKFSFHLSRK